MKFAEFNEIIEPNDQTEARENNLRELKEFVGNPYPNKFERSKVTGEEDTITKIVNFEPIVEVVEEISEVVAKLAERERPAPETKEPLNEKLKSLGNVRIAGRLATPPRVMGKAAFVHLSDGKNRLQIYVRKQDAKAINNDTGEVLDEEFSGFTLFGMLDHGDFVGVEGFLFLTNTGELSVHVETIQFLSKAMLPMPDKMHGIADTELRRRFRYADLIGSSLQVEHEGLTTREVFERRAKIISSMRRYLEDDGYIEVETPMLTPKATGAAAEPFETYHKALDITLFARIAPELYLKRLMVGGFEKVFELNRNFRNEGLSHKHNPEFTMLEFYCAYMDVKGMMDFCETLLKTTIKQVVGSTKISWFYQSTFFDGKEYQDGKNYTIDFNNFQRWTMKKAISKCSYWKSGRFASLEINEEWLDNPRNIKWYYYFVNEWNKNGLRNFHLTAQIDNPTIAPEEYERAMDETFDFADKAVENTSEFDESVAISELVYLFEELAEKNLIQPTFIIDYPKSISPLSKASPEDTNIAERFELFVAGMECANGFSELNDPKEQYERFADQMKERESGDAEAMVLDEDYIKALSYGMPPAAGIGIGIDRIVMLLTNQHSIRDVILFPHMRPERREAETEEE